MKKRVLNAYSLHNKTVKWQRYEFTKIISKFLVKSKKLSNKNKTLVLLKKWDDVRFKSLSFQTNVCKGSGAFKRTFDRLGFNRHMSRQEMNLGKIPNIRKLSW